MERLSTMLEGYMEVIKRRVERAQKEGLCCLNCRSKNVEVKSGWLTCNDCTYRV